MDTNYRESLAFLEKWCPGGPWVVTAIALDKKSIKTSTFRDADELLKWLEVNGKDKNLYFSVNSTRYDVTKKPGRGDVAALDWLHVDIDPRAGEDIDKERERALNILQNPPKDIPQPTVIVFSGGGYQGFWQLAEPKVINGEAPLYEDAKRYNQALELAFGADNCHNVDRIMRLPGTINRPDARKQAKGRTPELAKLVSWTDENVYPLSSFIPAPVVQVETKGFGPTKTVQVSGNIKRLDDVNALGTEVSDLCKVVIVQGDDPDDATRFAKEKRSGALFFVCCELVRAGVDNDTIYSVITDPEFRISESVLEKGTSMERYALRQIERARENEADKSGNLRKLNDKYAVVTIGGRQKIIYEEWDDILERDQLIVMSFEDFAKKYMNQRVQIGTDANQNPKYMKMGKWWLEHEKRRQYERVTFAPGREVEDAYNMWRGFQVAPEPGDKHQAFLDHVKTNICDGSDELFTYVMGWMARAVQFPAEAGETAVVLRGEQGVGKGFLARMFGKLFGRHFVHVSNAMHLTGNFNAHLRDCVVLFADEAFYAGDKRHASTLKALVTEDSIMVTPKGVDTEMKANCLHIIMASNEDWVVPAGPMERRFCVLDVGEKHIQDAKYFGRIATTMRSGGLSNLLHCLMTHDVENFDVRSLPSTKALRDQKVHSFGPMQDWWYAKLCDGKILVEHEDWRTEVLAEELMADYIAYAQACAIHVKRGSAIRLGMFLKTVVPGELKRRQTRETVNVGDRQIQRPYYYDFPKLQELRDWWDKKFGGPYDWERPADDKKDHQEKMPF